jgi:hypothetical protein
LQEINIYPTFVEIPHPECRNMIEINYVNDKRLWTTSEKP